jgi:hypothetical protein
LLPPAAGHQPPAWIRCLPPKVGDQAEGEQAVGRVVSSAVALLSGLAMCLLVGCASTAQRGAVIGGEAQCQSEIDAIKGIDTLRPHMQTTLKGSRTPAMLNDRSRPSKEQRAAITQFDRVKVECQKRTLAVLAKRGTPQNLISILDGSASAGHASRQQLARGEITFAEFNQRADTIDTNTRLAVEQAQKQPVTVVR